MKKSCNCLCLSYFSYAFCLCGFVLYECLEKLKAVVFGLVCVLLWSSPVLFCVIVCPLVSGVVVTVYEGSF